MQYSRKSKRLQAGDCYSLKIFQGTTFGQPWSVALCIHNLYNLALLSYVTILINLLTNLHFRVCISRHHVWPPVSVAPCIAESVGVVITPCLITTTVTLQPVGLLPSYQRRRQELSFGGHRPEGLVPQWGWGPAAGRHYLQISTAETM